MNKILFLLVACLLALAPTQDVVASLSTKKEKTSTKEEDKKKPKSTYDRLFKDTKKHTMSKGVMTIHQYEDKLYLELPLSLIGREFLITSGIKSSSDLALAGTSASESQSLFIDKTDSLILFRAPKANVRINEQDDAQRKAFALSQANAIYKAFPIEGYNTDSTSVLFEVTSYFNGSNKDLLDLKGRVYGGGMVGISGFSVESAASYTDGIEAFDKCVSVMMVNTVKLSLSIMGLEMTEKPEATLGVQATLALLPEKKMHPREANPRVGTGYVSYSDYRVPNNSKEGYYATRRNITQDPIIFYLDTLINPSWREAIIKSADAWNQSFKNIGLSAPIAVELYKSDSTFHANNPMINTITFINNDKSNITAYNITDPRTGEIISSKVGVARNFAFTVRRKAVYQIADVDERFQNYHIPEDAVCEALAAYMLKAFGRSLGLETNLAGSMAYSPEQLRSPEFTRKNGIASSIMDDVMYNYLARPGDKERGVALIISKPGICDEFVLHYLYSPIEGDEEATLKQWAMKHDGDPRYFYGKTPIGIATDPRCQKGDLGNDPFAAIDAKVEHLKYVVKHSPEWFNDDNIPRDYKELFPDYVFIELYNNSLLPLVSYIGGIYLNEADVNSKQPTYQSIPYDLQKKAVQKTLDVCRDLKWLDSNREFLYLGGANTSMSDWTYSNGVPMMNLLSRLSRMGLSVEKSSNPYTQREYLGDIEKYLFAEVRASKPLSQSKIVQIGAYIGGLISLSPSLKSIQQSAMQSRSAITLNVNNSLSLENLLAHCGEVINIPDGENSKVSAMQPIQSVNYYKGTDIESLCYEKLTDARRYLQQSKSLVHDEIARGKCDFLIMLIDRILL